MAAERVRRASRLVEERENFAMMEQDAEVHALLRRDRLSARVELLKARKVKAEKRLKEQPESLGREQVLQAAEAAELHVALALGRATVAAARARRRSWTMTLRVGRARDALLRELELLWRAQ